MFRGVASKQASTQQKQQKYIIQKTLKLIPKNKLIYRPFTSHTLPLFSFFFVSHIFISFFSLTNVNLSFTHFSLSLTHSLLPTHSLAHSEYICIKSLTFMANKRKKSQCWKQSNENKIPHERPLEFWSENNVKIISQLDHKTTQSHHHKQKHKEQERTKKKIIFHFTVCQE